MISFRFQKKIQYFMTHLNLFFTLKIWLFFEPRAQHLFMCRGVMNRHQRWMKIELLVHPWRLNGDLNSDENDWTLPATSKAESSSGILVFASCFPVHLEEQRKEGILISILGLFSQALATGGCYHGCPKQNSKIQPAKHHTYLMY